MCNLINPYLHCTIQYNNNKYHCIQCWIVKIERIIKAVLLTMRTIILHDLFALTKCHFAHGEFNLQYKKSGIKLVINIVLINHILSGFLDTKQKKWDQWYLEMFVSTYIRNRESDHRKLHTTCVRFPVSNSLSFQLSLDDFIFFCSGQVYVLSNLFRCQWRELYINASAVSVSVDYVYVMRKWQTLLNR